MTKARATLANIIGNLYYVALKLLPYIVAIFYYLALTVLSVALTLILLSIAAHIYPEIVNQLLTLDEIQKQFIAFCYRLLTF